MTLRIHVDNQAGDIDRVEDVKQAARTTLQHQGRHAGELTIVLTDDVAIRSLNQQYRSRDETTDVLSFPHGEPDPDSGIVYLGDVVLSVPQAQRQAAEAEHSLDAELMLLVVHGLLHLLGHDHQEEQERQEMWAAQAEILRRLQVELAEPPG